MLFTKKRNDGTYVKAREAYSTIIPFVMPTRTESLVYYGMTIDVANARAFLRKRRIAGESVSFFNLVIAAVVKTLAKYPRVNRFIAGKRLYARNNIEVCYTVKREMTQMGDESTAKLVFEPKASVLQVTKQMEDEIVSKKEGAKGGDDKLIALLEHAPRFFITFLVWLVKRMDYHGILPKVFRDELPFYCSVFVSNLGSLGMQAPYHHLYEIGTCSIFLTIGRIDRTPEAGPDGKRINRVTVNFGMTADERVVDGFCLSRAIAYFTHLIQNPELIDQYDGEQEE